MNNIISVDFNGNKNVEFASGLMQWDVGQVLKITGLNLTGNIEVHFSLKETIGEAQRSICTVDNGILTVAIPGFILQADTAYNYNAYAFVYVSNATAGMTVKKIVFDIKARPKPAEWVTPDEPDTLSQVLDLIGKKAEKSDTLAGYGIKDAYTKREIDEKIKEGSSGLTEEQLENIDAVPEIKQGVTQALAASNAAGLDAAAAQSTASYALTIAQSSDNMAIRAKEIAEDAEALAKQDLVTISNNVSNDGTIMMTHNTETRLASVPLVNDVPTLILNLPDTEYGIVLDYMSWVIFPACDVTPSVTVVGDISWSGVDCDETGAFTPVAGVNYRLQVRNIGWNGAEPKIIGNVARW